MDDLREALRAAYSDLPGSDRTFERLSGMRRRRVIRRRVNGGAFGLAIAAALIAGLVALRPSDTAGLAPATGVRFGLGDGYRYEREVRFYQLNEEKFRHRGPNEPCPPPDCPSVTELDDDFSWDGDDGTSESRGRQVFFDPAERAAYESELGVDTGWQDMGSGPFPGLHLDGSDAVPTEPDALSGWLEGGNAMDGASPVPPAEGPVDLWHAIFWDLLVPRTGSPEMRAAAVSLASELRGVGVDRQAVDPVGRAAISLRMLDDRFPGGGAVEEWIYVDARTLAPLALVVRWSNDDRPTQIWVIASDSLVDASGVEQEAYVQPAVRDLIPFTDPRT